mmetsp:Transcript_64626/g.210790  ORF Transcript_64626/g.210790 Transcript_64626/m.210790 type:complete len:225 (+) Transcript_64626:326-1000(+)
MLAISQLLVVPAPQEGAGVVPSEAAEARVHWVQLPTFVERSAGDLVVGPRLVELVMASDPECIGIVMPDLIIQQVPEIPQAVRTQHIPTAGTALWAAQGGNDHIRLDGIQTELPKIGVDERDQIPMALPEHPRKPIAEDVPNFGHPLHAREAVLAERAVARAAQVQMAADSEDVWIPHRQVSQHLLATIGRVVLEDKDPVISEVTTDQRQSLHRLREGLLTVAH